MSKVDVRKIILVGLFAALTAVGAFISIPLPFSPVPFTLQTVFTMMSGFILGSKYGAVSQFIYLLLGAIGIPVFANRMAGFAPLVGPTMGYLWGFVLSAYIIGLLNERFKANNFRAIAVVLFIGLMVIYLCGVLGLMIVAGLGFQQAVIAGIAPFFISDLLKIAMSAFLIGKLKVYLR